jgi:hypothetical protein
MLRLSLGGIGPVVYVDEREGWILSWEDCRLLSGEDKPKDQSDCCKNQTAAGAKTHEEYPRNSLNQWGMVDAVGSGPTVSHSITGAVFL